MLKAFTFFCLLQKIPNADSLFRTCIPHTQFFANGRLCTCDGMGQWNEANCRDSHHYSCRPGQIIWEDCNQCVCQDSGVLLCTSNICSHGALSIKSQLEKGTDVKLLLCIPFMTYYINCSLCVCPVSGRMAEARCATDADCPFKGAIDYMQTITNNFFCIPKVMYFFSCHHCLCPDDGFFDLNKCIETCSKAEKPDISLGRCLPRTLYKKDCNICLCPNDGIKKYSLCTETICNHHVQFDSLNNLRKRTWRCQHQSFTGPKCFYCECTQDGSLDEQSCIESECLLLQEFDDNYFKTSCSIGEMLPRCMECLCLKNNETNPQYCTKDCTDEMKFEILKTAVKESSKKDHILDRRAISKIATSELCIPNTIYEKTEWYCLCPGNGYINLKFCTNLKEELVERDENTLHKITVIDSSINCVPNTFVEFDCNICYCLKSGTIDPKWCTYDDCQNKRAIMEKQAEDREESELVNGACAPGSISRENCNFCICPDSGLLKDRACTKNKCAGAETKVNNIVTCEPITYYSVDCNECYCPKDGIKNVDKCTKNICEKYFLRSEICVPGTLFSEECNVCVCPPNGDKVDRVCTNHTCNYSETPWKKIFQLSQSLMSHQNGEEITRSLDFCFPGEEYEMGCKICLCPDMGLRIYATCMQMLCDDADENITKEFASDMDTPVARSRRGQINCLDVEDENAPIRKCTPGSMYIIKCEECICPYIGNLLYFCRPLPSNMYCEQAYPGINFLPSRRDIKDSTTSANSSLLTSTLDPEHPEGKPIARVHTTWECSTSGRLVDDCFICDCKAGVVIQEHCFKSKSKDCTNVTRATFFKEKKYIQK